MFRGAYTWRSLFSEFYGIIGLNLNIYSFTVNCSVVVIPLLSACTASLWQICKYAFLRPLGKRQVTPHVK